MKSKRHSITTTLPLLVLEELKMAVNETGRSPSDIVEEALRQYLINPPKNS